MIITLLRKPLEGSVADNALKHGCGAINIDGSRIGNIVQDTSKNGRSPDKHKSTVFQSGLKEDFEGKITTGRWPANFILTHLEGCDLKGEDWACVEGCPVKELDQQSGISKSTGGRIGNAQGVYSNQGRTGWGTGHEKGEPGFGDTGGASRFFKQFKTGDDQ